MGFLAALGLAGCSGARADDAVPARARVAAGAPATAAGGSSSSADTVNQSRVRATPTPLSASDVGIYPELATTVDLVPAPGQSTRVTVDLARGTLVVWAGADPIAVYGQRAEVGVGSYRVGEVAAKLGLAAADARALSALTTATTPLSVSAGDVKRRPTAGDRDGDGIPDPLDVLIGARKLLANGAAYIETYRTLKYPNGDVPRTEGVCTDTIIRAMRNAGLDLQQAVHEDIAAAPRAYPMVKKANSHIDHRRVKTLLPWFKRHLKSVPVDAPWLPGDIVFLDTFPSRAGPDHVGILSDRVNAEGVPLVINNWTDGATDAEMDLLGFVPVLSRFRLQPR